MADPGVKNRLFVDADLALGGDLALTPEHAHYLFTVMRCRVGDRVAVFNGRDGEWIAEVVETGKRSGRMTLRVQGQPQRRPPDLWLLFAPIKKARTDFIVEKATELGVARVVTVFTRFTNSERLRLDRLRAHAVEAAEQCGGTYVPEIDEPVKLDVLLDGWDASRRLMFCDEARDAPQALDALKAAEAGPWAVLIGPEGGFAPEEVARLRGADFVTPVTLGPRVLRADTAAVAALTVWQAVMGDWR